MKYLFLIITMFSINAAFARLTDNQVEIKIAGNKIEITTKPGFHLNAEAPAKATFDDLKAIFKPSSKKEKLFIFEIPEKTKKAKLSYYVCDDKKTVCEQHDKEVSVDGKSLAPANEARREVAATDLKSDKPTLLIFTAPWCPACLRMQTETYPQKSVAAQMKKLTIKNINIDLPENVELSEKFHVKAIPTLILLDKNGEEMTRWLDYQQAKKFAAELKASAKLTMTIAALEKKANAGDAKAISRRGMLAHLSYKCEDAIKWFSKSKIQTDLNYKLAAEVQCSEDKDNAEQIKILENAITKTSSTFDKVRWTTDLLEKLKEEKAKPEELAAKATSALEDLNRFANNEGSLKKEFSLGTYGDAAGFEQEEALLLKSRLNDVLGNSAEKQAALDSIKANGDKHNVSVDRPGEMLLAIAYLREAGEKVRVQEMYQQLLNKYPNTYVYHEKYSRYQFKNKNYDQALASVNSALQYLEGNEPKLLLLKAEILRDMKNKEQALAVVADALKLENISHKKFKKTLASIQTLKTNLEK